MSGGATVEFIDAETLKTWMASGDAVLVDVREAHEHQMARIEGSTLVIPDPMGATGGTILRALEHLKAAHGMPSRLILIPLICTPEFLRAED